MDKLKMHSPNLAEGNIAKLAELFPNCVTESQDEKGILKRSIDFDLLRQELSESIVDGPQERYHLNWPGKREALLTANAPIAKTLRPCREESVDFDTTRNLFIEGDNLDALKLLQETYLGKVKMIYIDPPYNTGSDFVYVDDFSASTEEYLRNSNQNDQEGNRLVANTESNGRFHSDWLSMIYSRLRLAKNLMREDGAIFISIDDGEVANLRMACDEIFGHENHVCSFAWQKRYSPPPDTKDVGYQHEIVVMYRRSAEFRTNILPLNQEQIARYKCPDNDPRGPWKAADYTCRYTADERPNLYYPIYNPNTGEEVWPKKTRVWAMSSEVTERNIAEDRIWWGPTGTNSTPALKNFLSEIKQGNMPSSLLLHTAVGHTDESAKELRQLIPEIKFTPKPCRLLQHLISISSGPDDLILDFFAGSATTAHAVFQLNSLDGGHRRFILVQIAEECDKRYDAYKAGYVSIAEIAKERIRRAGQNVKTESALSFPNSDIGFRVLKVDSSNMGEVYYAPDAAIQEELFKENFKLDRTSEDLLFQVLLDWGVDLSLPIIREKIAGNEVYFVDGNALAACFISDGRITEDFVKLLAEQQPLRVVFRDAGFKDDSVKINVEQIFKLKSPHTDIKTI